MLVRLSGGDLVKVQELYKLPIVAIFNHLSYQISGGIKTTKQN